MQESHPFNSTEAVDHFLNRLSAPLKVRFSPSEVGDTLEELRSHLAASIRAHEELGLAPQEATEAAIQAFGDPHQLAQKIVAESKLDSACKKASLGALCGAIGGAACGIFMTTLVFTDCLLHGERFGGGARFFEALALLGAIYGVIYSARPLSVRRSAIVGAGFGAAGVLGTLMLGVLSGAHNGIGGVIYILCLWAGGGAVAGWLTPSLYHRAIRLRVHLDVSFLDADTDS